MQIVKGVPPNIAAILQRFNLVDFTPVFAYGDILYNPSGLPISDDLMVHEEAHSRQQKKLRVEDWWNLYLSDNKFRLSQEVEAYGEQYKFICQNCPRHTRRSMLQQMAKNLSSALYGNIISKKEAEELIKNYG